MSPRKPKREPGSFPLTTVRQSSVDLVKRFCDAAYDFTRVPWDNSPKVFALLKDMKDAEADLMKHIAVLEKATPRHPDDPERVFRF